MIASAPYAYVLGTGAYLPERVIDNHTLMHTLDTTDEWIVTRTGIRQRHWAQAHETTAYMAQQAAQEALTQAGVLPETLDLILVATTTSDYSFPSTACWVQAALGAHRAAAFDIQAVCSGFMYALHTAQHLIASGAYRRVLLIGSECLSRLINQQDRTTAILFGDGAGAVLLEAKNTPGLLATQIGSAGESASLLYATAWHQLEPNDPHPCIHMKGNAVFKQAVQTLTQITESLLLETQITAESIDWLVPHQANLRIIEAAARHLQIPWSRVVCTVDRHANTSAASIPLALHHAIMEHQIRRGDRLLLESFGAGFTWGAGLLIY